MRMSWEYIAGFFDGEGSIHMYGRHVSALWQLVQTQDRGYRTLQEVQSFMQAHAITAGLHSYKRANQLHCLFIIRRISVEDVCRALIPFARIKKTELQDVLRMFSIYPPRGPTKGRTIYTA